MSDNPYAPPTNSESGSIPNGWHLEGDTLFCLKQAQLPPVDPFTGETGPGLLPVKLHAQPMPKWLPPIILASSLGYFVSATIPGPLAKLAVIFVSFALNMIFVRRLMVHGFSKISCYRMPRTRRRAFLWTTSVIIALLPFSVLMIAGILSQKPTFTTLWFLLPIILWFPVVMRYQPKFTCRRKTGEFFEIANLHPAAIEFIRQSAASADRAQTTLTPPAASSA